jgi:hypothetical protein
MTRKIQLCAAGGLVLLAACGPGSSSKNDAGPTNETCAVGDASYPINCTYDPGFTETSPNTPNTIGVTFSGETLGIDGLPYVPNLPGDPVFVDGWSVKFFEYIVVVGNIRLNTNPTEDSTWKDMGGQVAIKTGPFVFDAHQAHGFLGKDGVEPASGLFLWTQLDNGQPFDTSVRYAFSYDVEQAAYPATNVNLNAEELGDYDLMVKHKWSKFIRGVATHTATGSYTNSNDPNAARAQTNFAAMPTTVNFAFGWDDHTQILNCVNTDNGDGVEDNLDNRGVQTNNSAMYVAQITMHTDHIFWDTLEHEGEPLRFDPIAAMAPANTTIANPFWINDLHQNLATTFQDGTPLPDRGPFMMGNQMPFTTDMPNNGVQVILDTAGVTTVPATSYPSFMQFSVQSQAHLNAQGLCYIVGQHPEDPYYQPEVTAYP